MSYTVKKYCKKNPEKADQSLEKKFVYFKNAIDSTIS